MTVATSKTQQPPSSELPDYPVRAFTTAEAANYCSISVATLKEGRQSGYREGRMDVPRHTALSTRKCVYLKDDLDAWLEKKRAETQFYGRE